MKMIGMARLGRDVELRKTASGDSVAGLSLAFNYGRKDQGGKRPTQWVDASLWGKQAEVLVPYLTKGRQVCVTLDDVHIESYQGKSGDGHKLAARVSSLELVGDAGAANGHNAAAPAAPQHAQSSAPAAQASKSQADADDDADVPF